MITIQGISYVAVTSNLNLRLESGPESAGGILEIDREEIPANYRLLVRLPILSSSLRRVSSIGSSTRLKAKTIPVVATIRSLQRA